MILKQIKYILWGTLRCIWHDLRSGYDSMSKPKELLNLLFWLSMGLMLTNRWHMLKYVLILYVIVYLWKIIRYLQEEWRHKSREEYKIRAKKLLKRL